MNLQYFPDFLSKEDQEHIINKTLYSKNWKFGHGSDDNTIRFWSIDLTKDAFFSNDVFNKICETVSINLRLIKVYANGQTYGQSGNIHKDVHDGCDLTFLYYPLVWKPIYAGHLILDDGQEVISVLPKENLGLMFKSDIDHVGMEPSRHYKELRVSIAFKMKVEKYNV